MPASLPPYQTLAEINADNQSNWSAPEKVFGSPDTQVTMNEKEQTPPINRKLLAKKKALDYKHAEALKKELQKLQEKQTQEGYKSKYIDTQHAEALKKELQELKDQKYYKGTDIEKKDYWLTDADKLMEKKVIPAVSKAGKNLYHQSKRISIPIARPNAFKAGMFNKGFVRPYASEASGNFTLTKGSAMNVDTGGFDTQDEFKRNDATTIYVPQARTGGQLKSKGSLSVNMGVNETKMNLGINHAMDTNPTQYEIPSGLKNMARNRAVNNSFNRNLQNNNMRSDMNLIPIKQDPTFWDDVLVGAARVSQRQGVPLKQGVGQDRVNYAAMTNGVNGSAQRSVSRYNNGTGIAKVKSPSFKVNIKSLELQKPSVRTKHHRSVIKNLDIKSPKIGLNSYKLNIKKRK